jgi:hypothetical protein
MVGSGPCAIPLVRSTSKPPAFQQCRCTTQGIGFRRLYPVIRTLLAAGAFKGFRYRSRTPAGGFAAMYMLRPICVYLACMLSILVMCGFSAVGQAEELPEIFRGPTTPSAPSPPKPQTEQLPEILRGPTTPPAPPPPKPAVARCGNLTYGYVEDYQCCCTHWNGYNYRYCIYSRPRNSDGSFRECAWVCRNSFPCI